MRLLRLDGEGLGGRAIDLHPEISVVTDIDDDLRDRMLRACQAVPGGEDPGCGGLIEAHGVLFDLDVDSLSLMGLDEPLDVLVEGAGSAAPTDDGPSTADVLDEALAVLRHRRGELDRAQLDVLARLEEARSSLDPFARTAFDQAKARADRDAGTSELNEEIEALEDPEPLAERLAEIERIERELEEVDLDRIVDALDAAMADDEVNADAVEAGRLAVELRQIDTELADLDKVLEAQGLHPVELARRRDSLSVDVARLESEHAPRALDPDDAAELERVHDQIVTLEEKIAGSLLGGRNAERRLEEAIEAERVVLDRMDLPTYSAYIMSVTVGRIDPALENRLHEARRELAACQTEFEAATQMLEDDPARTMLALRQEEIVARATELIGRDPGPDVVRELLRFKTQRDEADPIDDLRHALERAGLIEAGLPLEDDELRDFAAAWIEEMVTAIDDAEARAAERVELETRLATIESALADAQDRRSEAEDVEPTEELTAARERLEAHEQAVARVAELTVLLEDVDRSRHELDARLEAQQALADLARGGSASGEPEEDERAALEAIRLLVRNRLHAHRQRSFAGSVPMVIRGLFSGFDRDHVGTVLTEIEENAAGVQLIILDDDLPVVTWATSVGFERAAVVSPE